MWNKEGKKLTGWYGTWSGREVEISAKGTSRGKLSLIHNGETSPGPEWEKVDHPYRFGYPPARYWLDVDEIEVSNIHSIEVCGVISGVKVWIIAEDDNGKLAIESDMSAAPNLRNDLAREYSLEYYDPRSFVFGWVPAEEVRGITTERREIKP